jgi:hypothetical protein
MLDPIADPGHTGGRQPDRRHAVRIAGRGDAERRPREALAREPEPARGHVTESVTSGGGNHSTHILDR